MATILLIDDEESERVVLQVALEAAGHRVLSAADGREGLRLMHNQVVDLVLVDLVKPDMDGPGAASVHNLSGNPAPSAEIYNAMHEKPDNF